MIDEHYTPSSGLSVEEYARKGDVFGAHHLVRYTWLGEVLTGREATLLDVGCGSGYGSFLIARKHPGVKVLGVDYDPTGIAFARDRYARPNLSFAVADAMRWDVPELSGEFDAIVSFDSIEHIPHRELVLEHVVNHLAPTGRFFLSTPCGTTHNELSPVWQAHRLEYGAPSLFDFLSRYFAKITRPEDPEFTGRAIFDGMRAWGVDYLLHCNPVICALPIRFPNPYRA